MNSEGQPMSRRDFVEPIKNNVDKEDVVEGKILERAEVYEMKDTDNHSQSWVWHRAPWRIKDAVWWCSEN